MSELLTAEQVRRIKEWTEGMDVEPIVAFWQFVCGPQLLATAEDAQRLRAAITEHHAQNADDRCWLDDIKIYEAAGLPPKDTTVGDEAAMLKNCVRFIAHRCHPGGTWKSYAELEAENGRLRAAIQKHYDCFPYRPSVPANTELWKALEEDP